MKIPAGKTEAEVLGAMERAVDILAPSFVFGPYDLDDIKQQARLYGLELLEKEVYDPSRPLENFLYTHIRNRLLNLVRDHLKRNDAPCKRCHSGEACQSDGSFCEKFLKWQKPNLAKSSLMRPLDIERVADEQEKTTRTESCVSSDAEINELVERIDTQLPADMRADYLRMRDNVAVPKVRRKQIEEKVLEIIGGN